MSVRTPEAGRRLVLVAMLVDTLGSGLVLPFELLFGTQLVGLSLAETGIGLSIGTGLGIAAGPISGALVDRFGPVRLVIAANGVAAAAAFGLLFIHGFPAFVAISFLFAVAARTFWAAYSPLVAAFVEPSDLETWFGRFRGARYAGLASGSALAGVAMLAGRETGLRVVVLADGASYLVAIGLYLAAGGLRAATISAGQSRSVPAGGGGYRAALRDRENVGLAAMNVLDTLIIVLPFLALPVYALDQLQLPAWVPGAVAAAGTVAVAIPTIFAGRITRGRRRLLLLAAAAALWALGGLVVAAGAAAPAVAGVLLFAGIIFLGVGEAVYAPVADALPLALAPADLAGRYSAIHQLAWGISGTIAPALAAALLAVGPSATWLAIGGAGVVSAAIYLLLDSRFGSRVGAAGSASIADGG